jgi:Domain of unknown function (DUF4337)
MIKEPMFTANGSGVCAISTLDSAHRTGGPRRDPCALRPVSTWRSGFFGAPDWGLTAIAHAPLSRLRWAKEAGVEAQEIAEKIRGEEEERRIEADADFRKLTGIYLGIVAMLLAITTLGGANATKTMLNANIQSSDTYGFYQAKYARQTAYRLAADQLEAQLTINPTLPQANKTKIENSVKHWRATAERYETDPATGTGKQQLLATAKGWQAKRDRAAERDPNFDYSEALFQIAIVLGSVSIVAVSRPLLRLSGALATAATLLMLNGYFLLVSLPLD